MISLIANDAALAILRQATGLAEIRDSNGQIIGFFAPVALEKAHLYAEAAAHFDPSENQRRKAEKLPGRTTGEVLEHLRSLEQS